MEILQEAKQCVKPTCGPIFERPFQMTEENPPGSGDTGAGKELISL